MFYINNKQKGTFFFIQNLFRRNLSFLSALMISNVPNAFSTVVSTTVILKMNTLNLQ